MNHQELKELNLDQGQQAVWDACGIYDPLDVVDIKFDDRGYSFMTTAYFTATENLRDALRVVDERIGINGKEILTIDGAGDSVQGFLAHNADFVTKTDISGVSCFWSELKTKAHVSLPEDEYSQFLALARTYSPDCIDLLEENSITPFAEQFCRDYLFSGRGRFKGMRSKDHLLPYGPDSEIDLRRSMIVMNDLESFLDGFGGMFDIIYGSNAPEYKFILEANRSYHDDHIDWSDGKLHKAFQAQVDLLSKCYQHLNPGGAVVHYLYHDAPGKRDLFTKAGETAGFEVEAVQIASASDYATADYVMIFKKVM